MTAMFLHGGVMHIVGNMVFFWAFAPEIEDAMGHVRFLAFYLIGGVVAFLVQIAVAPHSTVPNVGASGAIAAVMGAFFVTYPGDRIKTLLLIGWFVDVVYVPAWFLVGLWIVTRRCFSAVSQAAAMRDEDDQEGDRKTVERSAKLPRDQLQTAGVPDNRGSADAQGPISAPRLHPLFEQ